ncbi:hypothetical protein MJO29_005522 [Puccinia striiformis f. sp. tritici]|nr:hypothetical protein MJO29_005522 [Puccinia striiformis f. sp. tritici]
MDLRTRSRSFSYNATNLTVSPRRPRQLNRTQLSNSPVGLTILNASDGFTRTQLHAASKDVIGMTLSSNGVVPLVVYSVLFPILPRQFGAIPFHRISRVSSPIAFIELPIAALHIQSS